MSRRHVRLVPARRLLAAALGAVTILALAAAPAFAFVVSPGASAIHMSVQAVGVAHVAGANVGNKPARHAITTKPKVATDQPGANDTDQPEANETDQPEANETDQPEASEVDQGDQNNVDEGQVGEQDQPDANDDQSGDQGQQGDQSGDQSGGQSGGADQSSGTGGD